MTQHEACMLRTAELELELYGEILSDSVREHYIDELKRRFLDRVAQYGGSRGLQVWTGHDPLR